MSCMHAYAPSVCLSVCMWSVARRPRRPTPYDQHDRRGEEEEDEGPADAGNGSMDVDEYAPRAGRAPRCAFRSYELHCMCGANFAA